MEIQNLFIGREKNSFFRERREGFFASGGNGGGVNSGKLFDEDHEEGLDTIKKRKKEREEKKSKEEQEEEAKLYDSERKRLKEVLEGVKKGDEQSIKTYNTERKKYKSLIDTILRNDFKNSERGEIKKAIKRISHENQKEIYIIQDYIRSSNSIFKAHHLKALKTLSISEILENLDSDTDRKSFIQRFSRISNDTDNEKVDGLYTSLSNEIGELMNNKEIENQYKKELFAKYIDWKCRKESREEFYDVAKEVLESENIKDEILRNNFLKSYGERMKAVTNLSSSLYPDDEIQGQEKREQKMIDNVTAVLGEEVAKRAKVTMEKTSTENEQSRMRAFLESVSNEAEKKLRQVNTLGIENVRKFVEETESLCGVIIEEFPGLSSAEKKVKQVNLQNGFTVFYEYLDALKQAERENSNMPILRFFYDGGTGKSIFIKEAFKKLQVFTKKEANQAFRIEEKRLAIKSQFIVGSKKYAHYKEQVNGVMENGDISDKAKNLKDLKILTKTGVEKAQREEDFHPCDFLFFADMQKQYGYTENEIQHQLNTPLDNTLPVRVIKKIAKVGTVPQNIITFFSNDRIAKGLEVITQQVSSVPRNIMEHGSNIGWFEKGDTEKMKETYTDLIDAEKMKEFLAESKEKIENIKNAIQPFTQTEGIYKEQFQGSVAFLEEKLSEIPDKIAPEEWESAVGKFSHIITEFYKQEGDKAIPSIILGSKDWKRSIKGTLNSISDQINLAVKSTEPEKELGALLAKVGFNTAPESPSLEDLSWRKQLPLFTLWSKGEGMSTKGIEEAQKLMQEKNEYDEYFIQSRTQFNEKYNLDDTEMGTHGGLNVYYYHDKRFIILDDNSYSRLKNFNTSGDSVESIAMELGFIFHEMTHSAVEKSPDLLSEFEQVLKTKLKGQTSKKYAEKTKFQEVVDDANLIFQDNKGQASAMEEVLANIGSLLQFEDTMRKDILENETDKTLYGLNKPLRSLIKEILTIYPEDEIKKLFAHHLYNTTNKKERVHAHSASTADAGMSEADLLSQLEGPSTEGDSTEKIEEVKLTSASRMQKLEGLKEREKTAHGLMDQLRDFKPNLPADRQKNLEKWVDHYQNQIDDAKHRLAIAQTETEAENILDSVHDKDKGNDKVVSDLKSKVDQISSANINQPNLLKSAWRNTDFLSLKDIGTIFTTTWEYIKRRHETRSKRRVGKVGHNMFNGIINGLAGEFDKEQQNAESSEVSEIQGALDNKSDAEVVAALDETSNIDSFKATVQEMAKRGMILWEQKDKDGNHIFKKKLNQLGASIRFYDSDFESANHTLLNSKLHKSFMEIYGDEKMFWDLYNENKSNIDSRIAKGKEIASTRGGIVAQLQEWLKMGANGESIPTHEYEGYVSFMVGDGTTDPWEFIYYLFMGVAEGALPYDAIARFWGKHSNDFPPIDGAHQFTQEKLETMKDQVIPNGKNSWDEVPKEFLLWVHANMMTNPRTVERSYINMVQNKMEYDHDCAHLLASIGNADGAIKMLALGSTGNARFKPTIYNQAVLGMMTNLSSISLYSEKGGITNDVAKETIRRQAGYFGAMDIVANNRAYNAKKSLFTFKKSQLMSNPRGGSSYNGSMNTNDYFEMGRAIYTNVSDTELKMLCERFIFDTDLKGNNGTELIKRWNEDIVPDHANYPSLSKIFNGNIPELKADNLSDNTADIVDSIFTYFLSTSPNADRNLQDIINNSNNISRGKGIAGVEGSEKWKFSAMENEKGEIKVPDSYEKF